MYDSGIYTCVIENSLGSLNRSFELIVQGRSLDRPVFISKSTNLTQYEGDNVTLECLFYSDSSPFVQWFIQRQSNKTVDKELEFIKVSFQYIQFFFFFPNISLISIVSRLLKKVISISL